MGYKSKGFSKLVWGLLLLLAAAFIIANQIGGFVDIGFWSILVGALALAYSLASLIKLRIASLPIPLAILYIVVQNPLDLPHINVWLLLLAAVLASVGLNVMLPDRWRSYESIGRTTTRYGRRKKSREADTDADIDFDDVIDVDIDIDIDDDDDEDYVVRDDYDNNPNVSVSFGGESRYLHSDSLEAAHLSCKFGALEVYFDQAKLSPDGAEVFCDCKFGSIELYVPKEWRVKDAFSVTVGNAEIGRQRVAPADDAPVLKIKGDVAFGSIEVHFV